jgi:RNA polymerase sigma-70 factor (TIGR02960 family)
LADSVLARAQGGDGEAFEALVGPYRRELQMHCYRMLASFQDAEDVLQETWLAAWQALDQFDGRSLRAWLYRIATNRCRNFRRDASRRPQGGHSAEFVAPEFASAFARAGRSDDPWWLEPYPDALVEDRALGPEARYDTRESIALSFVAALQHMPVQQRAVLVLRDVLGFSAAEAAEVLGQSVAAVNSALQRARSGVGRLGDPAAVQLPHSDGAALAIDRFVRAFEGGDVAGVVALLTDDVRLTMPPEPFEFLGRADAEDHLAGTAAFWGQGLRLLPTAANGQPAFAYYVPDHGANVHRAHGILVVALSAGRISSITRFAQSGLVASFGLPDALPGT